MKRFLVVLLVIGVTAAPSAQVQVMSAGAVEAGLTTILDQYRRGAGLLFVNVEITFATGPQLAQDLAETTGTDLLIAPAAVVDQAIRDGFAYATTRLTIGKVGVGAVVRRGTPVPDITTPDKLKQTLRAVDAVIYNQGSSGLYVEKLFGDLGLADLLKQKGQRYVNGAEVMERVIGGTGREIGFGAITEIRMYEDRGAVFAGPLPAPIQNFTTYQAIMRTTAPSPEAALSFLRYLATPAARRVFAATGVE